jgi:hypothetical protein
MTAKGLTACLVALALSVFGAWHHFAGDDASGTRAGAEGKQSTDHTLRTIVPTDAGAATGAPEVVSATPAGSPAGPHTREVRELDFGEAWPWTVDHGTLSCPVGRAVVFTSDGETYSVNDEAHRIESSRGWTFILATGLWNHHTELTPFIDAGLQLCAA